MINLVKKANVEDGNIPKQMLEFELSLRSVREVNAQGKVNTRVVVASASSLNTNENLNRVKFSIPITFPYTILEKNN